MNNKALEFIESFDDVLSEIRTEVSSTIVRAIVNYETLRDNFFLKKKYKKRRKYKNFDDVPNHLNLRLTNNVLLCLIREHLRKIESFFLVQRKISISLRVQNSGLVMILIEHHPVIL